MIYVVGASCSLVAIYKIDLLSNRNPCRDAIYRVSTFLYIASLHFYISRLYIFIYRVSTFLYIASLHFYISRLYIFIYRVSTFLYIASLHFFKNPNRMRNLTWGIYQRFPINNYPGTPTTI